jgi:hypothetical protein
VRQRRSAGKRGEEGAAGSGRWEQEGRKCGPLRKESNSQLGASARKEKRARPGAAAESRRDASVGPLEKRVGRSWVGLKNRVGRSRKQAPKG